MAEYYITLEIDLIDDDIARLLERAPLAVAGSLRPCRTARP